MARPPVFPAEEKVGDRALDPGRRDHRRRSGAARQRCLIRSSASINLHWARYTERLEPTALPGSAKVNIMRCGRSSRSSLMTGDGRGTWGSIGRRGHFVGRRIGAGHRVTRSPRPFSPGVRHSPVVLSPLPTWPARGISCGSGIHPPHKRRGRPWACTGPTAKRSSTVSSASCRWPIGCKSPSRRSNRTPTTRRARGPACFSSPTPA
jgi:hypothetical protein